MGDPRIAQYLDAASHLARGEFPVRVGASGDDEVGRLGRALDGLARRMERMWDEARLLASVTERVNQGLILHDVLDQVYESFRPVIPYDRIGFALVSPDGSEARALWARSESREIRLGTGYVGRLAGSSLRQVLDTRSPRILNDLEAYLRAHPGSESTRLVVEEGMRSSLTCPLVAMGKPVGFLFFSSRTPGAYADAHVETFLALSGQLSVILEKSRLYEQILHEQARSERLLLNVLPEPIALRLKGGAEVIADGAEATVIFADVAGFSSLAARVSPAALVAFLDGFFSELDAIAARCGVEKIKTIGDAYLAAAGVPRARPDHARAAADMALEAAALASRMVRPDGEPLRLRVGLHSGPVVAGVLGRSRLVYDLWGDTVNVARCMEAQGIPGRIQLSWATRERLGDAFRTSERGLVPIKSGGEVRTFWLEGRA
ncbi:MAG TPA: adenylate/guanylate cyclase domain-containing protein [Anaeromyxobacter sp.]|nr:adenylate/guanylate cyclase domain-containing protein [Anaeromyxobacter sp.]